MGFALRMISLMMWRRTFHYYQGAAAAAGNQFTHFSGHSPPLQIRNRLLPKAFPTLLLSRKTTAGDFRQKNRGEVRLLYELLPHPSLKRYNKKPSTYSTNQNYLRHLSFLLRHKGYACCAIILKINWIIATTCNMR